MIDLREPKLGKTQGGLAQAIEGPNPIEARQPNLKRLKITSVENTSMSS